MLRPAELLFLAVYIVPTVWALFDVLETRGELWAASGQSQGMWALVVFLVPVIGPLLYWFIARPRLRAEP